MVHEEAIMTGAIWRDVVNFLGDDEVTPHHYLPLIEMMAERHSGDGYFLQWRNKNLTDPRERAKLDRDLRYAAIGHDIMKNQLDALVKWSSTAEGGPYEESFVINWWQNVLKGAKGDSLDVHALDHVEELFELLQLAPADNAFIEAEREKLKCNRHFIVIDWLRRHHHWAIDLEVLSDLAYKTWPAEKDDRQVWDDADLGIVNAYYSEQQPNLMYDGDSDKGIDPFAVRQVMHEQSLGIGIGELSFCMYVILRSAYIDFMDEILEHSKFPQTRGSLRCVECGTFVGRRALGYGQLYCGDTCKKRAAKRRYRCTRRLERRLPTRRKMWGLD